MFDAVKTQLASAYSAGKHVTFIDGSHNADGSYKYADQLTTSYVAGAKYSSGTAPLAYVNGMIKDVTITKGETKYLNMDLVISNLG